MKGKWPCFFTCLNVLYANQYETAEVNLAEIMDKAHCQTYAC